MFRMDRTEKILIAFLVACVVLLTVSFYKYSSSYSNTLPISGDYRSLPGIQKFAKELHGKTLEQAATEEKLRMLADVIYNARKHVRGTKTSQYLKAAITIMNQILKDTNIDPNLFYERSSDVSTSVCPEEFMGGNYGFPLYYNGFVTKACDYAVPIYSLITVVKYVEKNQFSSFSDFTKFINSINETYSNVSVLIAMDSETFTDRQRMNYSWVNIVDTSKLTEGAALNKLIEQVTTPYILVARSTQILTNDSRIERLIGEIESLDVVAAGGAFRYPNGHWGRGCFQTAYRNYTLKYVDGYDESFHECVFCDYIQGPFVTTTKYLKQNKFQNFNEKSGLYEDWFLGIFQKGKETVVCPDSMFFVHTISQSSSDYKVFLQKWNVYKMFAPTGLTFNRSCEGHKISSKGSLALSPCDLQLNQEAIKLIMRTCEKSGVTCELQEGTTLGAVKMGKSLPWDLDFDIKFLATNCTACKKLEHSLKEMGISIGSFSSLCCTKKLKFGEGLDLHMYYKGYYGDFLGQPVMDSEILSKAGLTPTKISLDGQWVNVPQNPGLAARNRYGKEIYQHAEHWRYTGGKSHRLNYTTNRFLPCKYTGRHDCLDRYNGDGTLQFLDVYP